MIRHLTTLVLCAALGSMVLVGNAEACHKRNCGHAAKVCAAPAPAPCVMAAPCAKPAPAPCMTRTPCAPKMKLCCFKLPTFCHKKPACAPPVATCAPAPGNYFYGVPVSYPAATPQASAQH